MKTVLFTFDYELFLGESSGSVNECLIRPTEALLGLLKDGGFKAVFFVDTVYLMRLGEIAKNVTEAQNDYRVITEQLRTISGQGHYLFPHIHPHWLDAEYNNDTNEWSLSNKRYYRFDSISTELQENLFTRSMELIKTFLSTKNQQEINSCRAGGWCIQPFEHFKPLFLKQGIKNEWSVMPGKYRLSDAHQFDFRNAPAEKPVYRFSDNVCSEDEAGRFTEWTISTLSFTKFEKWLDFKISGLRQRIYGKSVAKGSTVGLTMKEEGDSLAKPGEQRIIASFEGLNTYRVKKYIKTIRSSNYYQFISHPKLLNDYNLKMVGKLFNKLNKMGSVQSDFQKA